MHYFLSNEKEIEVKGENIFESSEKKMKKKLLKKDF